MPLPQVVCDQDGSPASRKQALLRLGQALDVDGTSAVKTQVLRAVLAYAKRNLVEVELFHFAYANLFKTCNAIFNRVNLPDLLFLQHVSNQLNAIRDETCALKKAVLPMVQNYKRPLMLPLVRQLEKASFGFGLATILMRTLELCLPALAEFFTNELTAEAKLERLLNARLAGPAEQAVAPSLAEGFDEGLSALARLVEREGTAALKFFGRALQVRPTLQPALQPVNNRFQPGT